MQYLSWSLSWSLCSCVIRKFNRKWNSSFEKHLKIQESVAKCDSRKCINFALKYHLFCLFIAYKCTTFFGWKLSLNHITTLKIIDDDYLLTHKMFTQQLVLIGYFDYEIFSTIYIAEPRSKIVRMHVFKCLFCCCDNFLQEHLSVAFCIIYVALDWRIFCPKKIDLN